MSRACVPTGGTLAARDHPEVLAKFDELPSLEHDAVVANDDIPPELAGRPLIDAAGKLLGEG